MESTHHAQELLSIETNNLGSQLQEIKRPIVLSIEGNIGAGKSTFLRVMEKHFGAENIEFIPEPVHLWTNCNGKNMLEAFYSDTTRYAYMFQSFAFVTRLMEQSKPQKKLIRILERSGLSDHCFAENCFENGIMNDIEYASYQMWYNYLINHMPGTPDGIVYLRTTPKVCHQRMSTRNRSEETGVPITYLEQLHKKHEKWLPSESYNDSILGLPFVTLNGDNDFEKTPENQSVLIESVLSLVQRLQEN